MERIFCIGGAAGASILAVASVDDLMIWAWLLMAAELGVWMLLEKKCRNRSNLFPFSRIRAPRYAARHPTPPGVNE